MVKVAKKLVKPVDRRQKNIPVTEMVLANLRGGVAVLLEQLADSRIFVLQSLFRAWHADLEQPGAERMLPEDE